MCKGRRCARTLRARHAQYAQATLPPGDWPVDDLSYGQPDQRRAERADHRHTLLREVSFGRQHNTHGANGAVFSVLIDMLRAALDATDADFSPMQWRRELALADAILSGGAS